MNSLIKALRVFKELDPDSTVSTMLTFCYLNRDGFTNISDVVSRTGADKSTVSRQLSVLSQYGRGKKAGLDLLRIHDDPSDRRYKIVNLTNKGKDIMVALKEPQLYAEPPARSPIPDVEISKAFCDETGVSIGDTIEDAFEAGVRFGEQYHGIKEQD